MTKLRPQRERLERRQLSASPSRTYWYSWDLSVKDEPLLWALIKYRQSKNRVRVPAVQRIDAENLANLVSSITPRGTHLPILDLDFPHLFYASNFPGRSYLLIDGLPRASMRRLQKTFNSLGLSDDAELYGNLRIDVPVRYSPSTHKGHAHLYIDRELSRIQWVRLMTALRRAGVIELGYFVWSLRRGGNFVRTRRTKKEPGAESGTYTYGWLFKLRDKT